MAKPKQLVWNNVAIKNLILYLILSSISVFQIVGGIVMIYTNIGILMLRPWAIVDLLQYGVAVGWVTCGLLILSASTKLFIKYHDS